VKRASIESLNAWRARSVEKYRAGRAQKPQEGTQRARKAEEAAEYRRNREMRLVRARGCCELLEYFRGHPIKCPYVATQTHHVVRRSHHVDHSVENLRALCSTHHAYIHANVKWAEGNGWIKTEWRQMEGN
jgi:hypothetical protein